MPMLGCLATVDILCALVFSLAWECGCLCRQQLPLRLLGSTLGSRECYSVDSEQKGVDSVVLTVNSRE